LKKVVVLFPYPTPKGTLEQKTFETKEGWLEANNTTYGNLIILSKTEKAKIRTCETLAVFKEWLYWEKVE
jgi:hypothetical protein